MTINAKDIANLRAKTDLPMMDCKKALEEAGGNEKKAIEILQKSGAAKVLKKSERETKSGLIEAYVHDGKIGVLVEILCETDFVAKNSDFKEFVHNIALHIAATNPRYISKEQIPDSEIEEKKESFLKQVDLEGKPAEIVEKIVEGKLAKYFEESCLLEQVYIKDDKVKISSILSSLISKIGENIVISRFSRFEIGN